jgi:hypothetical protein
MPRVGAYGGGEKKPMIDWIEAHNEFSSTLYALFASQGVIAPAATCSRNVLVSYQFTGSGSQVLQDLISLHHPGHIDTQAPAFLTVKNATPIMALHVAVGNHLGALSIYFMDFGNWEAHLKLYPDAQQLRETEYHVLFLDGLTLVLKSQVQKERNDLLVFQRDHRSTFPEPAAPLSLQAQGIFKRLSDIVAPMATESRKRANDSAIAPLIDLEHVLNDQIEPERLVNWCMQLGDQDLTDSLVAAIQNNNFRRQS